MSGGILIEVSPGETRAAIVDGEGRLVELLIERIDRPPLQGGIHLGRVKRIEKSLNGAFVALAEGRDGFMRRATGMHEGQPVVVQVRREPSGGKGPTLTDHPTLVGRYVALTPDRNEVTYSNRLGNGRRRAQLETLAKRIRTEVDCGLALRAAAGFAEDVEIAKEAAVLREDWQLVKDAASRHHAPVCLSKPPDLLTRVLRDWDGEQVVIDNPISFRIAEALVQERMWDWRGLLRRHDERTPLFEAYGVADEVDGVCDRNVTLPDGLRLTIDPVEALTVIDIDSGGGRRSADDAILRVNRAALSEVVRQVRLRNLSGLIVVDFLNMRKKSVRNQFLQTARHAFRDDPMQVDVLSLTVGGLLELTRRRTSPPLHDILIEGRGVQPAPATSASAALRDVLRLTGSGSPVIAASLPIIVALEGPLAVARKEVERRMGQIIELKVEPGDTSFSVSLNRV
ncbi:MAG: ribonuclease E/G [Pseudomonadota bacterium]|nr:ribonuclease E/G [Pseudomonadota bacterium]